MLTLRRFRNPALLFLLAASAAPGNYQLRFYGNSGENESPYIRSATLHLKGETAGDLPLTRDPVMKLKLAGTNGEALKTGQVNVHLWAMEGEKDTGQWSDFRPVAPDGTVTIPARGGRNPTNGQRLSDITNILVEVTDGTNVGRAHTNGWPDTPVAINMQPGATLDVIVTGADGKSAATEPITIVPLAADGVTAVAPSTRARADSAGHYTMMGLLPGVYGIEGSSSGAGNHYRTVTLPHAGPVSIGPSDSSSLPPWYVGDNTLSYSTMLSYIDPKQAEKLIPITGKVINATTREPVPGLAVSLRRTSSGFFQGLISSARTGADGAYVLKAATPGHYRVATGIDGDSDEAERLVDVTTTPVTGVDILLPGPFFVRLRLLTPEGSPDLSRNVVTQGYAAITGNRLFTFRQVSLPDKDGVLNVTFEPIQMGGQVTNVAAGDVTSISVLVRDPAVGCARIELDQWKGTVPVHLKTGATLSGTLLDANGKPARDIPISVSLISQYGGHPYYRPVLPSTTTDAAGRFRVPALLDVSYLVSATIPGEKPRSKVVILAQRTNTPVKLAPGDHL